MAWRYPGPYLGLASLMMDSNGSVLGAEVASAVSTELRDNLLNFIKSLRFNPALSGNSAVPSRFLILFLTQGSKAFSDDLSWPWGIPSVADAVRNVASGEALPVVATLAFQPQAGSETGSGLEYLPLGSDWCPDLFTWTTNPKLGEQVRKWNPGLGPEKHAGVAGKVKADWTRSPTGQ